MFHWRVSLSNQILLAVFFGVAAGLFFGEYCRSLEIVGRAFVAIMQISVLPYIVVSLTQSFGSLDPEQARLLAKRGAIMILALWAVVFTLMSLMPLTFPHWQSSSFFSPGLFGNDAKVDYIQLFIPANPFNSLANNIVPAVTLFSILCGLMLMHIPRKKEFIAQLDILSEILSRLTMTLVKLSPFGIFALVAQAAGTMRPEDVDRMELYLIAFVVMALLLIFLILPLLLSTLTPFGYREVLRTGRAALLTTLLTGNLFIVLPLLVENTRTLFNRHHLENEKSDALIRIIVPIAFILPCAGQLMDLLFILFSGWFSHESFGVLQHIELYGTGLLALFGSAKVAVPFLLGMFHLPSDLFEIYLVASVLTENIKFAVEAMAVLVLAALFTAWMTGHLRYNFRRLCFRLTVIAGGCAIAILALALVFQHCVRQPGDQKQVLDAMRVKPLVEAVVFDRLPDARPLSGDHFEQIRSSGVLRVGFNANAMPFAFFNRDGKLVGFDIQMAHLLARELGCRMIEFYPIEYDQLGRILQENRIDIAMSEVSITARRLSEMAFTDHYMELSMALLVEDYRKKELLETPHLIDNPAFVIAALEGADFDRLSLSFQHSGKLKLEDYNTFFTGRSKADALLTTAENGSAWTILHPEYDLILPRHQIKDLIAYAIHPDDQRFQKFLNFWLILKRSSGETDRLYNYWIKGLDVIRPEPRWSILHDVLHGPEPALGAESAVPIR